VVDRVVRDAALHAAQGEEGAVDSGDGGGGGGGQRLLGGPGGGLIPAGGPRVIEVEAIAKEVGAGVEKGMAAAAGGKAGGKAGPAFLSGGENKLLMITSATITALNAPKVILSGMTEGIKEIREGQFVENRFAGPGREFLGEIGGLIGDQSPATRAMIQAMFGSVPGGGFMFQQMQGMAADAELRKKPGPIQREKTFEEVQTKRLDTERQLNSILLERTKTEREMVDETKNRIQAAREEFGLLDVREKQATIDIAKRVAAGGVGQLSSEEMKFARGNVAFRGILAEEAAKGADAAGFAEIVKLLGLDRNKLAFKAQQTDSNDFPCFESGPFLTGSGSRRDSTRRIQITIILMKKNNDKLTLVVKNAENNIFLKITIGSGSSLFSSVGHPTGSGSVIGSFKKPDPAPDPSSDPDPVHWS